MRRLLFRSGLGITGLGALFVAWVAGARPLSMMLDRLHTVEIESQAITRLGVADAERGMLQVNELPMSTATPEYSPYPMEMKLDPARQFVVQKPGHEIVLGRVNESLGVNPAAGDKARLRIERSMLSWPTPLAINFMTGHSPSWKRHLYYRLTWEKPDGGRLEMVWRYERYYYDSWASGFMTRPDITGLIRVDIRP
ncbi:MAG: hypothetical protein ACR2II_04350 [Chthoniobacterales bacterium]